MTLFPRIAVPLAAAILLASPLTATAQTFSPDQQHQIENIIKNYLIAHPEVLQDAQAALDKQQQQAQAQKAQTAIKKDSATLFNSPHQVVLGNPNGKVTVVEFFDYNCPHCKDAVPDMLSLLKTDHDLKFVLKEFPILAQGSVDAAHVAVAVRMQDPSGAKYLAFHQKLFSTRGMVDQARALAAAKDVGCDMTRIEKDMNSPEVSTTINEDMKLADAIGVDGTPSYVVGDQLIVGAIGFKDLQQKVAALENSGTAASVRNVRPN
jgi:protein-disulfide isomerase